jgi:hypothetical protein
MRSKDQILLEQLYDGISKNNNLNKKLVLEVNWDRFSDVKKVCYTPESVADALNAELDRLKITKDRPSADANFARVSRGNIPTNEEGRANIEQFKKQITQRPKTIFDKGEKSLHSTDEDKMTINTGIPALRAVIWDEENKNFYVMNTCPGAQDCIANCYALQGFYIMNDGKNIKLINRLQWLMSDPDTYEKQAFMEAERYAFEAQQDNKELKIRWNDAGDLFSEVYFNIADNVTKQLKAKGYNVNSYIYTKIGKYVKLGKEKGMTMTFSSGATKKERDEVGDMSKTKTQITVPKDVFKQFLVPTRTGRFEKDEKTGITKFASPEAREGLRKAIVDFYNTHPNSKYADLRGKLSVDRMKFTDELPKTEGEPLEFDTITMPSGDTDSPAQRRDVRFTFLLIH